MTDVRKWAEEKARELCSYSFRINTPLLVQEGHVADALVNAHAKGRNEGLEEAKSVAALFTVKPDASIYPGLPFDKMNEQAKTASHTTAQQIAAEISALKTKEA